MGKEVSIIIPSLNEGENLCKTIRSVQETSTGDYEIIVVDNGSTDGSTEFLKQEDDPRVRLFITGERLGVAGARNFGAAFADGDIVICIDAHVTFCDNWLSPVLEVLGDENIGIVAPAVGNWEDPTLKGFGQIWKNARLDMRWLDQQSTAPYAVPMAGGCCQAFRWDFFHAIGGYDPGMVSWGHEDLEICLRTWLLGYRVVLIPQVEVYHFFREQYPYDVGWFDVIYNMLRTTYAHFNKERIGRVLSELKDIPYFEAALRKVNISDIWNRRRMLEVKRIYDDDWYFSTFSINC